MNETYTREQAMDRLGIRSANAFFQLERKYPEAFVVVKRNPGRDARYDKDVRYDKDALDKFAERGEYLKQEKP